MAWEHQPVWPFSHCGWFSEPCPGVLESLSFHSRLPHQEECV